MSTEEWAVTRVVFERGYPVRIIAIDGTSHWEASLHEVSESEATVVLAVENESLTLDEFFLCLSSWGSAHRRCERAWSNGDQIGVRFIRPVATKSRRKAPGSSPSSGGG